jgi:osmotically inducible protein OsmC
MTTSQSSATWRGTLKDGEGKMAFTNFEDKYTFSSRFEDAPETNPEELAGAAHAGCYSMFLSALASKKGLTPSEITTRATVTLGKVNDAPTITRIELSCEADIPSLSDEDFQSLAAEAKANCPISKLYAGTEIVLTAKLTSQVSQ